MFPFVSSLLISSLASVVAVLSVVTLTYLDIKHKNELISHLVAENTALKLENQRLKTSLKLLQSDLKQCNEAIANIIITGSSFYFSTNLQSQDVKAKENTSDFIRQFHWTVSNQLRSSKTKNSTGSY